MKFKMGDKVKLIANTTRKDEYDDSCVGNVGEVTHIFERDKSYGFTGSNHWFYERDFELAEDKYIITSRSDLIMNKEEMTKYLNDYGNNDNSRVYKVVEVPINKKVEWSIGE